MISYYCRSCWGTQGGQCEVKLDGTMNDVVLCPVTGEAEAEWIANSSSGKPGGKSEIVISGGSSGGHSS